MNTDTKYYAVFLTRELQGRYYVKAEDEDTARELAWEKFDDEIYREEWDLRPNSDAWEYHTQIDTAESDWSDEWLVADDEEEEDFLAAVNNGGEV